MQVIGLTGGVGSGKSMAAGLLQEITGGELLIADDLGHVAMEKGTEGYCRIIDRFGGGVLSSNGQIDRKKLAELVFGKPELLQELNHIVHPIVKDYLEKFIHQRKERQGLIILESAILFETGCDSLCDEVWYVWVPENIRIQRLQDSRGYTREKCKAIMAEQMGEETFRERCDRVVVNDGSKEDLERILRGKAADLLSMVDL